MKYKNYFEKEINNVCHLCIVGYKKYGYHLMSTTNNLFCTTSFRNYNDSFVKCCTQNKNNNPFQNIIFSLPNFDLVFFGVDCWTIFNINNLGP